MTANDRIYTQKIEYARSALWAPFYLVGYVARIRGDVHPERLEEALCKIQLLHPPLASRVKVEADGHAWLTTADVAGFPLEVRPRVAEDDWIRVCLEQQPVPIPITRGPLARFILLRGREVSDLVACTMHLISDGYSMGLVMWDIVSLLNEPGRPVALAAPPPAVTWRNVPHAWHENIFLRGLARASNLLWPGPRPLMQWAEYEQLHRQYWANTQNSLMSIHLSPQETSGLVTRCRQHGAAVTGALTAAFLLAQEDVRPGGRSAPRRVSVALNMRDRLLHPPGPVVGVHASTVDISLRFRAGTSFWELARLAHTRIHAAINDLPRIHRPLVLEELDPRIVDSLLPPISTDRWPRGFGFLTHFLPLRGDVRRLDVSNIGRLTLPDEGVPFRLEAIHPLPPLVPGCGMEISSVTWNNRMNITVNYRKSVWDDAIMQQVRVRALEYLAM